jgi:two-component sensor histidine kinase
LAGLFILILLIVFLFYTNTNIKKRETELAYKNTQIEKQNLQIENSLKEKEMLLKEIHHRVKNNLQIISSVINLQLDKLEDKRLKDVLEEIKMRISSIALTHQMLYQKNSLNHVLLHEFVKTLLDQIENSYQKPNIKTKFSSSNNDFKLNIDVAIPLGLLINEIVTNAYKHAFNDEKEGEICVTAERINGRLKIIVKDNGRGIASDHLKIHENTGTLGFELISILSQQLNAQLEITLDGGTVFTLDFSI